ncbi:unnamed protein product [Paramecium primaurelia]|uniref:Uncharacterized protein n=1 Tax=Paramecium primaurelia TaxID=5886 RepID=A0A8S1QQ98_PARPR|nr:unnamed protein product [Paramecium primaurelia]
MKEIIQCKNTVLSSIFIRGGGLYDKRGNDIKIGKWIELNNKFNYSNQLFYKGEYDHVKKQVDGMIFVQQRRGLIFGLNHKLIFSIFQTYQNLLVEVDHMIKLEMGLNRVLGQKIIKNSMILLKLCIMEIIKMVRKLEFCCQQIQMKIKNLEKLNIIQYNKN